MRHLVLLSFSSCGAILDTHRQYLQTEVQIARNDFTISVYCRIVALVHGSSFPIWGDMLNSLLGYHGKYTYPRPLAYAKRFVEVLATPHRHHATPTLRLIVVVRSIHPFQSLDRRRTRKHWPLFLNASMRRGVDAKGRLSDVVRIRSLAQQFVLGCRQGPSRI